MASPWQGNVADWLRTGSGLFAQAAQRCTEADFAGASLLPGWSRSHVVSHVSANAQAIGRLLHWARTGEPLPMYPSMQERDREIAECHGETDIFIYPPYEFKAVDALLTNFHLPCSTLMMLVSAIASRELILEAYAKAVEERYRFYSYGDCMFIV